MEGLNDEIKTIILDNALDPLNKLVTSKPALKRLT